MYASNLKPLCKPLLNSVLNRRFKAFCGYKTGNVGEALGIAPESAPEASALHAACREAGVTPQCATPLFAW